MKILCSQIGARQVSRHAAVRMAGLSNDQIAGHGDQPTDRETRMNQAMATLDVCDRAQLVTLAYECGLVTPPNF